MARTLIFLQNARRCLLFNGRLNLLFVPSSSASLSKLAGSQNNRRCHATGSRFTRSFCTTSVNLEVSLSHPTFMVWSSNTGVGKTLVSAGLASSILLLETKPSNPLNVQYIKPVQTGFPIDSDSRCVYQKVSEIFHHRRPSRSIFASNHVLKASEPALEGLVGVRTEDCTSGSIDGFRDLGLYEERELRVPGSVHEGSKLMCKTMYAWKQPISPHLAVERESAFVSDSVLLQSLQQNLLFQTREKDAFGKCQLWNIVEIAGGVASPGPSGTLQCDLYRPFRLPGVLVGDGRLGGISGTISAYETLKLRGYDVAAIILEDNGLSNEESLLSYLHNRLPVLVLPAIPRDLSDNLMEWFGKSWDVFGSLHSILVDDYTKRMGRLHEMSKKAGTIFWWPFTQHSLVPEETVTVIDSRSGENFAIHKVKKDSNYEFISHQFDACASWWTQGPDSTLQMELARDMGYATARYGHIMFPENVYEPALHCAELLLLGVGKGWASRVFFSDNGSTSIEISLKMAFRKFASDHALFCPSQLKSVEGTEFKVLALNGSYHGDTLGAMEAQAPSPYTGFLQQPWYSGRGFFLDPPTVFCSNEHWNLCLPQVFLPYKLNGEVPAFSSREEVFCGSRDSSELAGNYSNYIHQQLSLYRGSKNCASIAALIIEPVIHGAGGMHMIDPLFQRVLVRECRNQGIPIIYDEVFTGFWRLGVESAAEFLGCVPDIACFAKLMTGGIVPLSVTLATEAVFDAFKGDSKLMALLHGHSYSAHALGCTAAAKAIQWFKDPHMNPNIIATGNKKLRELWDCEMVSKLSSHSAVKRVVSLGTLCAIELKAEDSGYGSLYAISLVRQLREDGVYMRPLGNVIYLMCGPCTSPQVCYQLLSKVYRRINELGASAGA
ncbi:hypothetical protein AMTRI_Chr12g274370 [Amborella trichopoda]|uniref:bifunctional dethiobiotin synthetase/7,8-diamino-pelargonic acid aminotransferase, mitochondrial n=1 Tax=Amborella trichopoda TaxID=13333 RepID=UPI0005D3866F|nr:bifunctional dethiobiotin synthetase/7,8-diamino-pelargonic acid aminotransferase, mitochondrial [Amborella trichopoda]|eukprot:XP_011623826.1 bifunctional dethiobiotin synthetase/7,8-diamino-pelargonic acid aminotransferase, mitochondrial [Amborella trichopoda]